MILNDSDQVWTSNDCMFYELSKRGIFSRTFPLKIEENITDFLILISLQPDVV